MFLNAFFTNFKNDSLKWALMIKICEKITSIRENENFKKLIIGTVLNLQIQNNLKYWKYWTLTELGRKNTFFEYLKKFVREKTIFDHNLVLPNFQYFFNSGFQVFSMDTHIDFSFSLTQLTFTQFVSLNPIWGAHFLFCEICIF